MTTERQKHYIETIENAFRIAGIDEEVISSASVSPFVESLLPMWDEIMPLLVSDIVKAVKKELQNV